MIPLHTPVLAGTTREPGTVIARERLTGGGIVYRVRFRDGRVRMFGSAWVCVAVTAPRLRLVVDNERRA